MAASRLMRMQGVRQARPLQRWRRAASAGELDIDAVLVDWNSHSPSRRNQPRKQTIAAALSVCAVSLHCRHYPALRISTGLLLHAQRWEWWQQCRRPRLAHATYFTTTTHHVGHMSCFLAAPLDRDLWDPLPTLGCLTLFLLLLTSSSHVQLHEPHQSNVIAPCCVAQCYLDEWSPR